MLLELKKEKCTDYYIHKRKEASIIYNVRYSVFPETVHYFVHLYHRNLAKRNMCMLTRKSVEKHF